MWTMEGPCQISTDEILKTGEETLAEFQERGGIVTELEGDALTEFNTLMSDKVIPVIAETVDADVISAASAFAAN